MSDIGEGLLISLCRLKAFLVIALLFPGPARATLCSEILSHAESGAKYWGAVIPGLALSADEMPLIPGLLALENPGMGNPCKVPDHYSLEDVARCHAQFLHDHRDQFQGSLKLIGMSMGGMILSILASKFRHMLPEKTEFHFFVTSSNFAYVPAVPDELAKRWLSVDAKDFDAFRAVLAGMFSEQFVADHPAAVDRYTRFRMAGGNRQSGTGFLRQLEALRDYVGEDYYPHIRPEEAFFIGGKDDTLFGPEHTAGLERLLPDARFREVEGLGHMIHLERPDLFDLR